MNRSRQAEVVIVGGGPVGMLTAAELGGYGVRTVVLETADATADVPKAGTLHARTVQSLTRRGYLRYDRAPLPQAEQMAPFHFAGVPGLAITAPGAEPQSILKRAQADLERDFEAHARRRGVTVLRGHRVVGVQPAADGVQVTAEGPDGVQRFGADYLVGADGARSMVREQAGIGADTVLPTVSAMMGVVRLARPGRLPPGWWRTATGWLVVRHQADGYCRLLTLDPTGAPTDRAVPPTLEELADVVEWIIGHDVAMADPQHLSRFSDFTRLAHSFRQGRVLLAGDAAHVHFPVGGQGLSTGLLDALNLSWKLAHTVHGTAGKDLLDSSTRSGDRRRSGWSTTPGPNWP